MLAKFAKARGPALSGKPHFETGSLARVVGDADAAAVIFDDGFGDRETESRMARRACAHLICAIKALKQMRQITGRDARASWSTCMMS